MQTPLREETLADLKCRHCTLIKQFSVLTHPLWASSTRLLNQLASVQIDLLLFHSKDSKATLLGTQLSALEKEQLAEDDLLARLLSMLCPVA